MLSIVVVRLWKMPGSKDDGSGGVEVGSTIAWAILLGWPIYWGVLMGWALTDISVKSVKAVLAIVKEMVEVLRKGK